MSELTFVGAAGTVTGSKHLLAIAGRHIFIDCGLFQGVVDVRALNDVPLPVPAAQIDAVVITHGHLDHVGYLPKLVRDGFAGPVFCTPPTQGLMQIVLDDAAHLQQELHDRGFNHERPHAPPPYYDESDVVETMRRTRPMPLATPFDLLGVATATYRNAGHILGSAFVSLEFEGKRVTFSGDLGRYGRPLLYDPDEIGAADVIVSESTYGDRIHPPDPSEELRVTLDQAIERGGPIVIPAFAVERSQDILLSIAQIQARDPRVAGLQVHLDSPMAAKVDALFEKFPDAHKPIPHDGTGTPFGVQGFSVEVTTEQSKALNALTGPAVVVSASGMASGGRILHHLHNHLADPEGDDRFPRIPKRRNARVPAHARRAQRSHLRRHASGAREDRAPLRVFGARRSKRLETLVRYVLVETATLCGSRGGRVGDRGRNAGGGRVRLAGRGCAPRA